MMPFFQPDWLELVGVIRLDLDCYWAGLQALALLSSAKTRKKKGRQGLRPWPLRCLSQFLSEKKKIDCLEGECVAYLSPIGWPDIYSICIPSWMAIRILSHWKGYFLLLSVSDLIDIALYLELSFFLIGGIWLDL